MKYGDQSSPMFYEPKLYNVIKQICLRLSDGDMTQADTFYQEWEVSKVYEWLEIKLIEDYKPPKKK